jgi:hypothetical protein
LINAAFLRKAADMGLSLEQAAELAETIEAGMALPVPDYDTAAGRKKARDAARMRALREAEAQARRATVVSDVAATSPDKEAVSLSPTPPNPSQEITTPFTPLKGGVSPAKLRASRRCPQAWTPSEADLQVAAEEGFSPGEIDRELAKIRDYQFRDAHSDWGAVFRGWIRRAAELPSRRAMTRNDRPASTAKLDAKQANMERAVRGAEIALARRAF